MERVRPVVSYVLLSSAAALGLWGAFVFSRRAAPPIVEDKPPVVIQKVQPQHRPKVDVVFVLDTTGSMSSLLSGAKRKIWEMARFIAQGQPAPELRIGLVAYRDKGDEYVTKFFDLTDDIDGVYQNLTSFAAGGGGDTPEHVAQALHEAVYNSHWSDGKNTLKLIYLVGDAPPHTDYDDGYDYRAIAKDAIRKGIRINAVRCGSDDGTRQTFTEIASLAGGDFSSIDQSGGMADVRTPFDEELARLNRALTETAIPWGDEERRSLLRKKAEVNMAAPIEAQAERAGYFGLAKTRGRAAATSDGDLLDDVTNKKVDVAALKPAALPEPMQKMDEGERKNYLAEKRKAREEVLNQINSVAARRDAYLKNAAAAAPASKDGFDGKVRATMKKQAAEVGVAY